MYNIIYLISGDQGRWVRKTHRDVEKDFATTGISATARRTTLLQCDPTEAEKYLKWSADKYRAQILKDEPTKASFKIKFKTADYVKSLQVSLPERVFTNPDPFEANMRDAFYDMFATVMASTRPGTSMEIDYKDTHINLQIIENLASPEAIQ